MRLELIEPFVGVIDQIGVSVDGDLEISTGAAREEISVNLIERYSLVDEDAIFFEASLLQNQHRHKLSEQFTHIFEASGTCRHIIFGMAHGEKYRFDAAGVR